MNLDQEFQKEMIQKMAQAKIECKYNPTRFNQMIARYGGVETAKRLIDGCIRTGTPSEGYTTLLMAGRTDLTLEDSVCNPKYSALFTKEEIRAEEYQYLKSLALKSAEDFYALYNSFLDKHKRPFLPRMNR